MQRITQKLAQAKWEGKEGRITGRTGTAVRERRQLKPPVRTARPRGSRCLRSWHRQEGQPGPHHASRQALSKAVHAEMAGVDVCFSTRA